VVPKQQNIPAIPAKAFLHLTLCLNPVPSTLHLTMGQGPTSLFPNKASLTLEMNNLMLLKLAGRFSSSLHFIFLFVGRILMVPLLTRNNPLLVNTTDFGRNTRSVVAVLSQLMITELSTVSSIL